MIDLHNANYGGTPVSPWRLKLAYTPADPHARPVLSIVTPFYDAGPLFRETVQSVMGQSLQQWEWILVDDGSTDAASLECLEAIAREDSRVRIIQHAENRGRSAARNTGINAARTAFVYPLDQDDLLEPTALEKCLWCLATHPEYSFVNAWCVGFGAQSYLWNRGFDREDEFLIDNQVSGRALIRRSVFDVVGGYDESFRDGFEDWDFWLRCADRGLWGVTIPESLEWFRRKAPPASWEDPAQVAAHRALLAARYPRLAEGAFPRIAHRAERAAPPPEALPFDGRLTPRLRRLLLVATDVDAHANGAVLLSFAELLFKQNWQLTVAVAGACDAAWELALSRYTADVHVMERILAPSEQPRFLHALAHSRRPAFVLFEAGEYGRTMTRHLRSRCPDPTYIELAHDDPNQPGLDPDRVGSDPGRAVFDLTICTTGTLATALGAARGGRRIEVVPPGVDTTVWKPRREPRKWLRPHWGAGPDDSVVLIPGGICQRNRPRVLARTLRELARRDVPFRAVIQGDGDERDWLRAFLRRHDLEARVRIEDTPSPDWLLKSMAAADILFAPADRGLPMHVLRAMAMCLPIVALATDELTAVVAPDGGILSAPGDEDDEVRRHADAIQRLAADAALRLRMGRCARRRTIGRCGTDRTAAQLFPVLARSEPAPRPAVRDRRAYARAVEYATLRSRADTIARERSDLAREVARRADRIRELEALNEAQAKARSWLEEQHKRVAAERERSIQQLENAREWLDEQRLSWHDIAQRGVRQLAEAEALAEEHAARIAVLEREIARLCAEQASAAERLAALSQRWWPGALRQGTAEAGRALRAAERAPQ
jgi:GT2 family glycosyltransferase